MDLFNASAWNMCAGTSLAFAMLTAMAAGVPALRMQWRGAIWFFAIGSMAFSYLQHVLLLLESAASPLGPPIDTYDWLWVELDPCALAGLFTIVLAFRMLQCIAYSALPQWSAECASGLFPLAAVFCYRLLVITCDSVSLQQVAVLVGVCVAVVGCAWAAAWERRVNPLGLEPHDRQTLGRNASFAITAAAVLVAAALGMLAVSDGAEVIRDLGNLGDHDLAALLVGDYRYFDTFAHRLPLVTFVAGNGLLCVLAGCAAMGMVLNELVDAPEAAHAKGALVGEIDSTVFRRMNLEAVALAIPLAACLVAGGVSTGLQGAHDDCAGFPTEAITTRAGTVECVILGTSVPDGSSHPRAVIILKSAEDMRHINAHDLRKQLAKRYRLEEHLLSLAFCDSRVLRGYHPSCPIEAYAPRINARYCISYYL